MSNKKKEHSPEQSGQPLFSGSLGSGQDVSDQGDAKKSKSKQNKAGHFDEKMLLELKHTVAQLKEENETLKNNNMRLQADIQNFSRQHSEEINHTRSHTVARMVENLIDLLDGFDACIKTFEDNPKGNIKSIEEGVHMTHRMFLSLLSRYDVQAIEPALGDAFDPHQHEAMAQIDDAKAKSNSIVQLVQKGYRIKDRVIRSARVILAK